MGLGVARRCNPAEAGGKPQARPKTRASSFSQASTRSLTLARAARDYHEHVIEPRLSTKHAAQWIASLENDVPLTMWHKPISELDEEHVAHISKPACGLLLGQMEVTRLTFSHRR
jgi:hypothetical protein